MLKNWALTPILTIIILASPAICQSAGNRPETKDYKRAVISLFKKSAKEIIDYLGKPSETSQFDQGEEILYEYFSKGVSFHFRNDKLNTIFFYSGLPGGFETGAYKPYKGRLPDNFSLNMTYQDILRVFGKPAHDQPFEQVPMPFRKVQYRNRGFGFNVVVSTGRIISIYFTKSYK